MNSGIRSFLALCALGVLPDGAAGAEISSLREAVLRNAAIDAGLKPPAAINEPFNAAKAEAGEKLFEFEGLSLNSQISCRSCHLPQFSSADGLPNAVGVGGVGEGHKRLANGGKIVPRNALALWGRGGKGFDTLFWDGKVEKDSGAGSIISQFGAAPPSRDPLAVAVHLPFVEFREMIDDEAPGGRDFEDESVAAAGGVFRILTARVRVNEELAGILASAYAKSPDALEFQDVADSIAHFIRREFRIRETKFHRFVFGGGRLTDSEIKGGLVFYGKGRCASCHNGAYFTDFRFHAVAFPQAGFGKNGFGVDYGRYNVTFNAEDVYRFRTPPLFNVEHTAPYSHSGSVATLKDAIWAHADPLRGGNHMGTAHERQEFYRRLRVSAHEGALLESLDEEEVSALAAFLTTLSFCKPAQDEYCRVDMNSRQANR